jgi:ribosomal protein S18 acetylase RimI-like enzyme
MDKSRQFRDGGSVTNDQLAPNDQNEPGLWLRDMTAEELPGYLARLEVEYANELHESTGISAEAAQEESRQSTLDSFPEGKVAPGERVWVAEDAAGNRVGVLWLAHLEPGTPKAHAWIYDIEVDEARRGEGWGRKLLALAEEQTRAMGLSTLRLNVFGRNRIARELYRSEGFTESRVTMVKDVGARRPPVGPEPVTASLDVIR